jgi:LPXTG-motif cell wall-anchored protein
MLRGNDAMKNNKLKLNRIALISIAIAAIMVFSPLTAFAAESIPGAQTALKVIYNGNGTTKSISVQNAENLDTFKNLMPNGTTNPQNIMIQNKSNKRMQVYFKALPIADQADKEISQKLLDTLQLKITFKMDDAAQVRTLYDGLLSGKAGSTQTKDIVSAPISLGYVYQNSDSGILSATLTAPETMGNEFKLAHAKIMWEIQFQLDNSATSGGGGGGTGGGNPVSEASSRPIESIDADSTPRVGPSSSATEIIDNEDVPLSKPPKTGENSMAPWMILIVAVAAVLVFIVVKRNMKANVNKK